MVLVHSDIIQFRGTHYEFGYKQGELLQDSPILRIRKKQWGNKGYHFLVDEKEFLSVILKVLP